MKPRFSVIVPVYSQPELLLQCLRAIRASTFRDYELLVSDDGSPDPDAIRSAAEKCGAVLVRSAARKGSAAARNSAARMATADHLVFFDADVTVGPDTLALFAETFDQNPSLDAVIGSYDCQPSARNGTSQFRNLLHAHTHQSSRREATTFWTGCGAVGRERFLALGGFKESFTRPSIEDVEFGLRLHRAGGRILLAPEIQVTHHKAWDLFSMVRTDLLARAIPWASLIREHGLPPDLNFKPADRLGVALTALAVPIAIMAVRHGAVYWTLLALALAGSALLQAPLLRFLASAKGKVFAVRCFPLLLVYNLTCVIGLAAGLLRTESRRDRWLVPGMLACGGLILILQLSGGAYRAEFDGSPDEAAHFVSGLMVYDYLAQLPHQNPFSWAQAYYLHYPKVAIGHWPPGYYLLEAGWWLIFPPSRTSAMLFTAALMFLVSGLFYHLLRTFAPPWLSLLAVLLLISAPVVQQSYTQSMADLACLLWSVLLADAIVRLLRRPSAASVGLVALWLTCALLTKGSALCLVPAPLAALLMTGEWRIVRQPWMLSIAAGLLLLGFGWYAMEGAFFHESLKGLSGLALRSPWQAGFIPRLAGYGFCVLACAGILTGIVQKHFAAVASAAILCSTVMVSWFVRAMAEPRHFIIVIPALLLLSVDLLMWIRTRAPAAILLGLPALALFPFTLYVQRSAGFVALLHQIPHPARMLVSSNGAGEGAWIAEVALAERRPSSVVARASKILSRSGWNLENYRATAATPGEIETLLDQVAIDTVVVHTAPDAPVPEHQQLLDQMLRTSVIWRPCAASGPSIAYCRTRPPSVARQRLRIDLTDKIGRYIEEP